MSEPKDSQDDHDPDYAAPGPSDEAHQKLYEENARTNVARKITAIVEKEFSREIDTKEKEILLIEERLHKALKTLHFLRYVIITDFYNRKQCQNVSGASDSKQTRIHPAIKQMIGKSPRVEENFGAPSTSKEPPFVGETIENLSIKEESTSDNSEAEKRLGNSEESSGVVDDSKTKIAGNKRSHDEISSEDLPPRKIPRYVPPNSGIPEPQVPSRGARHKVRKRIVVGNISKWIPPDWREDAASHKWTMYVRGSKENAEIADFVGKVRFFLHPSYRPNDVVEVTSPPFHLSRRGWGEFPLRVQLHFKNPLNKPMDIIHYLKLDRTYTGLQTLGSETVVDVWIKTSLDPPTSSDSRSTEDLLQTIKKEPKDPEKTCEINSEGSVICNNTANSLISGCCVKIKEEPRDTDYTASHVRFEHDYANVPTEDSFNSFNENNVTISHSPPRNPDRSNEDNFTLPNSSAENLRTPLKIAQPSTDAVLYEEVVVTSEKDASFVPNNSQKLLNGNALRSQELTTESKDKATKVSTETVESSGNFLPEFQGIDSSKIYASVDVKTMVSGLDNSSPKLQPLRISIPAAFEALKKSTKSTQKAKQILILKDNKLIPIDSMNFAKVGMTIGRGVSLLKKPPNANCVAKKNTTPEGAVVFKLNPTNSLILNAANDIPALKFAESPRDSNAPRRVYIVEKILPHRTNDAIIAKDDDSRVCENVEISMDGKCLLKPKITLGKDKIGTTSKRESYEEILRSIDDAKITDVSALVRFIIRRVPLISERAADPEYRSLHPYACTSEKEFLDSNVGKQRALEWYRAKHVKSFLKKKGVPEDAQWTIKEIMIWSRLHGYTPTRSLPLFGLHPRNTAAKSSEKNIPGNTSQTTLCTFTEPLGLLEYLRNAKETKASSGTHNNDEVEIIDVENVPERGNKKTNDPSEDAERNNETRSVVSLGIPEKIVALQTYVTNTARQIGVKLGPEEIVTGVTHCAPARMIVRTVQCLLEDLLRSSLAKAWERSSDGGCPDTITLEDVRGAILSREEFDVFTNEGLGSHHCPDD